jgi:hypothetical protein
MRLWRMGLASRYPFLLVCLVGEFLLGVTGPLLARFAGRGSQSYIWFWLFSRVASSTLLFLVLLQVYQRLVEGFEGLRKLGQLALHCALGVASLIVLTSIALGPTSSLNTIPAFWMVEERGTYLALTIMSMLLLGFGVFFRLPPTRNVMTLFGLFGLLFAGQASLWMLHDFWGAGFGPLRVLGSSVLYCCCFLCGTVAFSPSGETTWVHTGSAAITNEGTADRLEEINQRLLSVFRL